ncbi:transcriptional regulator GutM [Bacillus sp. ISL-51]|uniref:transcriptional regulator GutM n=1 Tax=Bacteria TaxID=2 RepID=UPI001BEC3E2D|nr:MULTISPECIES: transcriptional regulator GutM [Bacteria]MBT2572929.1 transcriptional regulator GutM [Bacillus sp. ISL-51]MBT2635345.1 transcriptional regulator GutM [Bacillus sp. ISL-26]MBT2713402.1 transcriptional regulator GutM [Pseudomonas sp. ISL-88]
MMWMIAIIALAWLLQSAFGFLQIRHFNQEYAKLRKLGRVVIGKRTARVQAGTVVMFAIDGKNRITAAKKMQGLTVFSRIRQLEGFNGKYFPALTEEDISTADRLTQIAIRDALNSYHILSKGGELQQKKSLADLFPVRRKKKTG